MKMQQIGVIFSVAFIGASGEILALRKQVQRNAFIEDVRSVSPESEQEMQEKVLKIVDIVGTVSKQMAEIESKKDAIRLARLKQGAHRVLNIVDVVKFAKDELQAQQSEHVLDIVDVVRVAQGSYSDGQRPASSRNSQAAMKELVQAMEEIDQLIEQSLFRVQTLNKSLANATDAKKADLLERMINNLGEALSLADRFRDLTNLEFKGSQNSALDALKRNFHTKISANFVQIKSIVENAQQEEQGRVAEEVDAYEARRKRALDEEQQQAGDKKGYFDKIGDMFARGRADTLREFEEARAREKAENDAPAVNFAQKTRKGLIDALARGKDFEEENDVPYGPEEENKIIKGARYVKDAFVRGRAETLQEREEQKAALKKPAPFDYLKDQDEVEEEARQKASMDRLRAQPEKENPFAYLTAGDEDALATRYEPVADDEEGKIKKTFRYVGEKLKRNKKETTPAIA